MKFIGEKAGSHLVLIFGFIIIFLLTYSTYNEYQKNTKQAQKFWNQTSNAITKVNLITEIFGAQNQIKNTLDLALVETDKTKQHALFRNVAEIRDKIIQGRLDLLALPLAESEKETLSGQSELLNNGFASQVYFEQLLLDFDDREAAINVLFNEINTVQNLAQSMLSELYDDNKHRLAQSTQAFNEFSIASSAKNRQLLILNLILIFVVGVLVILLVLSRDRLINKQTNLLKQQNIDLEHIVAIRTRRLEEARLAEKHANEAKSEFLAVMSHEIRTPLNGMIGTLNLIDNNNLNSEEKRYLATAKQSSDLLLTVINDILDYSKIESGKFSLDKSSVDLCELIDSAEMMYKPLIKEKGLSFKQDVSELDQRWVMGDATRISQIINNYMNNALKFTKSGSITLQVASNKSGGTTFSVIDTGLGIKQEDLSLLFQDFSQIHTGSKRSFGGTGLGLVICKKLANLMGGSVNVKSTYQQGSTFSATLKLPAITEAQFLADNHSIKDASQAKIDALNGHILLVEDNKVNQLVAQKLLEKAGHTVTIANDGRECLDLLDKESFDLVLMDCHMPIMDGYEATREIRQRGLKIPIIALTANAQASDRKECIEAGMDEFISKPFKPEELNLKMAGFLKSS